jgi:hypothetical protein
MDPLDLVHGYAEEPERIVCPQIRLGRERQFRDVGEGSDIAWGNASLVERISVMPVISIDIRGSLFQPIQLKRPETAGLIDSSAPLMKNGGHFTPGKNII